MTPVLSEESLIQAIKDRRVEVRKGYLYIGHRALRITSEFQAKLNVLLLQAGVS